MSIQKYFLFFILTLSVCSVKTEQIKTDNLVNSHAQKIIADFDTYVLSACWIPYQLYKCTADEVCEVWAEVIKRLTSPHRLEEYFDKKNIDPEFLYKRISWQCERYHFFLLTTYVHEDTKKLVHIPLKEDQKVPKHLIPLTEYGRENFPDQWIDLSHFYCLYLDALSYKLKSILNGQRSSINLIYYKYFLNAFGLILDEIKDVKKRALYIRVYENFYGIYQLYAAKDLVID